MRARLADAAGLASDRPQAAILLGVSLCTLLLLWLHAGSSGVAEPW